MLDTLSSEELTEFQAYVEEAQTPGALRAIPLGSLSNNLAEIVRKTIQAEETEEARAYVDVFAQLTPVELEAVELIIASYHFNGGSDPWQGIGAIMQ
jgi:hypothetical protein